MHARKAVLAVAVFVLCAFPSFAIQRTFVSGSGSDFNPCTHDQPCRSFATAVAATNPNGEVVAVDSAGYGPVTITQGVTIVAPLGVHAGISVFSGDGVTINAGSGTVVLRNLYINSQGGVNGITLTAAGALHIEHCIVSGFSANNINLLSTSSGVAVAISDTTSREAGLSGILADDVFGMTISIDHCRFEHNLYGVVADRAQVVIRDSIANRCGLYGFYARGTGGEARMFVSGSVMSENNTGAQVGEGILSIQASTATNNVVGMYATGVSSKLSVEACVMSVNSSGVGGQTPGSDVSVANSTIADNSNFGAFSFGGAVLRLTRDTIVRNGTGIYNSSSTVYSTGDNMVQGNTSELFGSISPATKM